jgi:hypothetical protein
MTMKSLIAIAAAAAVSLVAGSTGRAACEAWDITGQKTIEQANGIVVLADFTQDGTALGGKANFVSRTLDPEKPWTVEGAIEGVVEGGAVRFRSNWRVFYINPRSDSPETWTSTGVYHGMIDSRGRVSGTSFDVKDAANKVAWSMIEPAKCIKGNPAGAFTGALDTIEKAGNAGSEKLSRGMENDTDRGGSDYRSFFLEARKPELCQDACLKENNRCRAWTYVRPGVQGGKPVCYLKDRVPNTSANTCCISGVAPDKSDAFREPGGFAPETDRAAGAAAESGGVAGAVEPGMENNTDRPGNDYNRFVLTVPSPKNCKAACDADQGCAAWTYVRPGVQQKEAVCYVKRPAPAPVSKHCCISGKKSLNPAALREQQ